MAKADAISLDFAVRNPDGFARTIAQGETSEVIDILEALPLPQAAAVVARMPVRRVMEVLNSEKIDAGSWLTKASMDDAIKFTGRLPRESSLALVNSLDDEKRRRALLQYLRYPAHSVGSVVSDVLLRLSADEAASDALRELRSTGAPAPAPVVLVTTDGRYFGLLDTWSFLMTEKPSGKVGGYASKVPPLRPELSLVAAALDENWQHHAWLPVVDHKQRVVGAASRVRVLHQVSANGRRPRGGVGFSELFAAFVRVSGVLLTRFLSVRTRM